jgi:hypothetical protein
MKVRDIDNFEKHIKKFFEYFPSIVAEGIIGVLAGSRYQNGAEKYGRRRGFFVFISSEGMMKLLYKGRVKISGRAGKYAK